MSVVSPHDRLRILYQSYVKGPNVYLEHGTTWKMTRWQSVLGPIEPASTGGSNAPDDKQTWLALPLTRADVSALFAKAISVEDAVRAFVASMIWGFGDVGYGPYRTAKMLNNKGRSGIGSLILGVRETAQDSPAQAYEMLKEKIDKLGPSFATKVVYFASTPNNRGPILDSVVSSWLWSYDWATKRSPVDPLVWNPKRYKNFISFCDQALDNLRAITDLPQNCNDRGFIEYLMFMDRSYFKSTTEFPEWIRAIPRSSDC